MVILSQGSEPKRRRLWVRLRHLPQHWLPKLLQYWRNLIEIRRAARLLSVADDYMLKDIGISRGDIEWAVRHGRPRAKSRGKHAMGDNRG